MSNVINSKGVFKITFLFIVFIFSLTLAEGKVAPSFKTRDIKGKLVVSNTINSKGPNIVFFWHSCCCLDKGQLSVLKELYLKYKSNGFEIIGIAMDGASKTAKVKKAVAINKIPWLNVVDKNNELKDKFSPTGVPAMFIIKNGKIINTFNGYEAGDDIKVKGIISALF